MMSFKLGCLWHSILRACNEDEGSIMPGGHEKFLMLFLGIIP